MNRTIAITTLGAALAFSGAAGAEEFEIRMLNRGDAGAMVFEPDYVKAQPGDTIRFVAADKGHNAETIKGMIPDGVEPFKGDLNHDITVTLTSEGVYGIKCAPHYAMGMVALIEVGAPVNLDEARAVKQPGKAKSVFAELFGQVVAAR
ncbi:MAG: pseudoazurin [Alphaproteobacteria bacterium]|nr:MAG: pseudoazurin [Alphaproteobacteria bacterium]